MLDNIAHRLMHVEDKLDRLLLMAGKVLKLEKRMSAALDQLEIQVAQNTSLEESAIALINGLAAQIADLKDDPARLMKLSSDLKAKADSLALSLAANTPADPTNPAPPAPTP